MLQGDKTCRLGPVTERSGEVGFNLASRIFAFRFPEQTGLNLRISLKPGTPPIWCPVRFPQVLLKIVGSDLLAPLSLLSAGPFRAPVLFTSKGYRRLK